MKEIGVLLMFFLSFFLTGEHLLVCVCGVLPQVVMLTLVTTATQVSHQTACVSPYLREHETFIQVCVRSSSSSLTLPLLCFSPLAPSVIAMETKSLQFFQLRIRRHDQVQQTHYCML